MVSCYARDAYLGRYLIKRNYFYTEDRNKFADNAYDEILTKVSDIKDRYYNEVIDVHGIFQQIKQSLDGVISELAIKEDSLGTTVQR
jgi:two-component SAPR family response regulator